MAPNVEKFSLKKPLKSDRDMSLERDLRLLVSENQKMSKIVDRMEKVLHDYLERTNKFIRKTFKRSYQSYQRSLTFIKEKEQVRKPKAKPYRETQKDIKKLKKILRGIGKSI